jgi:PAS domain S-box-containing protein
MGFAVEHPSETILDSITDGVFTVDSDWRITFFNRAAERITGVPRDAAVGRRCCDVFRASICETACALRQTLDSGQPVVNKIVYIVNSSGARVPISISTAVLRDAEGRMAGGVETFRDLTQVEALRKALDARVTCADLVGRSPAMRSVFEMVRVVAAHDVTVLIEGESGTGKELVARAIHELSPRRRKRFVAVSCGALPDTLLESELFGYRAGAFTDARRDKPGRFALAEGGTLFLDEIGDIPLAMQAKLLRVLQEREFEPLGGVEPVKANVRIVAATHRDLAALVADGRFRGDLFYRINVFRVALPPLRERREDIPLLVEHLVAKISRLYGKDLSGVSDEGLALLLEHDYPGNVRELENILEHAAVLCDGGVIQAADLPAHVRRGRRRSPVSGNATGTGAAARLTLRELETVLIEEALRHHQGNRTAAARALGVDPSTLFRRIKAAAIDVPPKPRRKI